LRPLPHYLLFVDDSGNRESDPARNCGRCGLYFVHGAILAPADEISRLAVNIQALEVSLAGAAAIEVKSDWLRIPKERRRQYMEPYGLDDARIDRLGNP